MSNLEKYEMSAQQNVAIIDDNAAQPPQVPMMNIIQGMCRRWYLVLLTALTICAIGLPLVWWLYRPEYRAVGAIRVAPILPSIIFSDRDSEGVIPMYDNFMNTQAELIKSDQVLHRVADELSKKDLLLFTRKKSPFSEQREKVDPVDALRNALTYNAIEVAPIRRSELIQIAMNGPNQEETEIVVNAFLQAYMAVEGYKSTLGGDQTLEILDEKRRTLTDQLQQQQEDIRRLSEEYGTSVLTGRHDMMLTRVADLYAQLTRIEAERLSLEVKVQLLEQTAEQKITPEGMAERRHAYINEDSTVNAFTEKVAELEEKLVVASQMLAQSNPELKRHQDLLQAFKDRLQQRKDELEIIFDRNISLEIGNNRSSELEKAKVELDQMLTHEKILQEKIKEENTETIALGRKQLLIQERQEQLELTKELYDAVRRRIQELNMERKRPARISIAYPAKALLVPGKKKKLMMAVIFASLACGMGLVFMLEKMDRNVRTPDDIIRFIGVPVIGTTAQSLDRNEDISEQVANEYQNIRANLGLLSGGNIPKILVITSADQSEGKTTFSINLSTSVAKTGKKVLLIDGDLRKPDIARFLQMPNGRNGFLDVISGRASLTSVIRSSQNQGLDVITANADNTADIVGILTQPHVTDLLRRLTDQYDHVIIDSPPVLAVPDALLWAKMADAVVLCSLAGKTARPALKETLARLEHINVRVLGNVLSNVKISQNYYRYGYNYRHEKSPESKNKNQKKGSFLLANGYQDENNSTHLA